MSGVCVRCNGSSTKTASPSWTLTHDALEISISRVEALPLGTCVIHSRAGCGTQWPGRASSPPCYRPGGAPSTRNTATLPGYQP